MHQGVFVTMRRSNTCILFQLVLSAILQMGGVYKRMGRITQNEIRKSSDIQQSSVNC